MNHIFSSFTGPVLLTQNMKRICQVHLIIKSFGRVLFVVKLEGFLKVKSVERWMTIEQKRNFSIFLSIFKILNH